ncbi:MAG: DUF3253 domain-containing protein [Henriciella sp.]
MSEEEGKPKKKKETLEEIILRLVEERGAGKTVCPSEAARAFREDNWQSLMGEVRANAVRLAHRGEIAIYRKGKPADPDDFKGVYRLGLPQG